MRQSSFGHFLSALGAHGAVNVNRCRDHAQHLLFRLVGIGHEATVENQRRTGNFAKRCGHQTASARIGGCECQLFRLAKLQLCFGCDEQSLVRHHLPHGRRTVAVAWATMPSPRPVKPSFSLVVALTATRSVSMRASLAMFARIVSRWADIRGNSQTIVRSRCAIRPPRARTRSTAKTRNRSDD